MGENITSGAISIDTFVLKQTPFLSSLTHICQFMYNHSVTSVVSVKNIMRFSMLKAEKSRF